MWVYTRELTRTHTHIHACALYLFVIVELEFLGSRVCMLVRGGGWGVEAG